MKKKMLTILQLQRCPKETLDNLPENMEIRGSLTFQGCQKLVTLPKNIKVSEYLSLWGCRRLQNLPNGLIVGEDLGLTNCEGLQFSIPQDLKVNGYIWINYGTGAAKEDFPKRLQHKITITR